MALGAVLVPALLLGSIQLAARLPLPRYPGSLLALGPLDLSRGPRISPLREAFIADVFGRSPRPAPAADARNTGSPARKRAPSTLDRVPVDVSHLLTNDDWAHAYRVPSVPFKATVDGGAATREPNETSECAPVGGTVWYRFDAPADVGLVADTSGTAHEVTLGVFTGRDPAKLQRVGCTTSARGNARHSFPARAGNTYYFQVATLSDGVRVFQLKAQGTTKRVSETGTLESANSAMFGHLSGDGAWLFYSGYSETTGWGSPGCAGASYGPEDSVTCRLQVFAAQTEGGAHKVVSVNSNGDPANDYTGANVGTRDGRYVAVSSMATNLVPGDTNTCLRFPTPGSCPDIFVMDRDADEDGVFDERHRGALKTVRVSLAYDGGQSDGMSLVSAPSGDGRYVFFNSWATNLVPNDTNGVADVFRHDRDADGNGIYDEAFPGARKTERVSVSSSGEQAAAEMDREFPLERGNFFLGASQNGRYAMFRSPASNVVPGDTNGAYDIFVRDVQAGITTRVNVGAGGVEANRGSRFHNAFGPKVSNDGRYAIFNSPASNLVAADTNGVEDLFVRDMKAGTTRLVTVGMDGAAAAGEAPTVGQDAIFGGLFTIGAIAAFDVYTFSELNHYLTPDGQYVFFSSGAYNLVAGDENEQRDVFVRDLRRGRTGLVSVSTAGRQAETSCQQPAASDDGRYVMFSSAATALDEADPSNVAARVGYGVFLRHTPEVL